jgi:hypothetical protein
MNPRPRTLAVAAVGVALLVQTWLWIGVMDAPLGYAINGPVTLPPTEFLVDGMPGELGGAGTMTISAGPNHFEQEWPLANGGRVHISEEMTPYSILLGGQPSHDQLIAAIRTRAKWQEATALGGRVNALTTTIGRLSISIDGPLSHDELFRIVESLQPGFASLL